MENNIQSIPSSWTSRRVGVLVVDDEKEVCEVLSYAMRGIGFRVWQAADGLTALKIYWHYRERIDVVLLDVQMPDLNGPQTLVELRGLTTRVHCCFISGDLGEYTEQMLLDMGAVAVFKKPIHPTELTARLLEIVTSPELNPSFLNSRQNTLRQAPI